jgi:hypothetical protein
LVIADSAVPPSPVLIEPLDAEPEILTDGKIRARVNLRTTCRCRGQPTLQPAASCSNADPREPRAYPGKRQPIVAAQSADPAVDRQVTLEVKATILK